MLFALLSRSLFTDLLRPLLIFVPHIVARELSDVWGVFIFQKVLSVVDQLMNKGHHTTVTRINHLRLSNRGRKATSMKPSIAAELEYSPQATEPAIARSLPKVI